jgi:hypothetical protein
MVKRKAFRLRRGVLVLSGASCGIAADFTPILTSSIYCLLCSAAICRLSVFSSIFQFSPGADAIEIFRRHDTFIRKTWCLVV